VHFVSYLGDIVQVVDDAKFTYQNLSQQLSLPSRPGEYPQYRPGRKPEVTEGSSSENRNKCTSRV
jgi:hypothetical protein